MGLLRHDVPRRALGGKIDASSTIPALATTETPKQNEASERDGQTHTTMTRCMLKDVSDTPEEAADARWSVHHTCANPGHAT